MWLIQDQENKTLSALGVSAGRVKGMLGSVGQAPILLKTTVKVWPLSYDSDSWHEPPLCEAPPTICTVCCSPGYQVATGAPATGSSRSESAPLQGKVAAVLGLVMSESTLPALTALGLPLYRSGGGFAMFMWPKTVSAARATPSVRICKTCIMPTNQVRKMGKME